MLKFIKSKLKIETIIELLLVAAIILITFVVYV